MATDERTQIEAELRELRAAMDLAFTRRDDTEVDRIDDRIFDLEVKLGIAD